MLLTLSAPASPELPVPADLGFLLHEHASSLLAVALGKVFRTAMTGRCDARPDLVGRALPLEVHVPALPARDVASGPGSTWWRGCSPRSAGRSTRGPVRWTPRCRPGATRRTSTCG